MYITNTYILPAVGLAGRGKEEEMEGVYALMKSGRIVYVGQSRDIFKRIREHKAEKKKEFDSFFAHETKNRKELEAYLIKTLTPRYNKRNEPIRLRNQRDFDFLQEAIEKYENGSIEVPLDKRDTERLIINIPRDNHEFVSIVSSIKNISKTAVINLMIEDYKKYNPQIMDLYYKFKSFRDEVRGT